MVGKNLKKLRHLKALTVLDLSQLSGVAPSTIIHIEQGVSKAHPGTIRKLANALGVGVEKLTKGN